MVMSFALVYGKPENRRVCSERYRVDRLSACDRNVSAVLVLGHDSDTFRELRRQHRGS